MPDRDKCASRASRWHRPVCCVQSAHEYPSGRAFPNAHASTSRYRADSRDRSIAQTPSPRIDRDARTSMSGSDSDSARHTVATYAAADVPSVERIPICRRTCADLREELPEGSRVACRMFKSVTPMGDVFCLVAQRVMIGGDENLRTLLNLYRLTTVLMSVWPFWTSWHYFIGSRADSEIHRHVYPEITPWQQDRHLPPSYGKRVARHV